MRSLAPVLAALAALAVAAPAVAAEPEHPVPPAGVLRVADAAAVTRGVAYSVARANRYETWRFVGCRRVTVGRVSCRYALRRARTVEAWRVMVHAVDPVAGDAPPQFLSDAPVLIRTQTVAPKRRS